MEQEIAAQVVGLGGSSDFSLWKLFLRADFVVKFVIILLIASSIFSWALIFDKFKLFKSINASTEDFEKKFWKAKSAESFNNNLPSNSTIWVGAIDPEMTKESYIVPGLGDAGDLAFGSKKDD